MPFPVDILGGLGDIAGSLINAHSTARQNQLSRQWSEQQYSKQRADAIEFWNMQNSYNSPQEQMKRFQAAGLNPNLIYGQGNAGNAGSITTPDVQPAQFRTPEWGNAVSAVGLHAMNAIYDLDIKQAQVDNLKAQNDVIRNTALEKLQGMTESQTRVARNSFELQFAKDLRSTSADMKREQLRQLRIQNDLQIPRYALDAARTSASVSEAQARVKTMAEQRLNMEYQRAHTDADRQRIIADTRRIKSNIAIMQKDNTLKQLDIDLRRQGINPQDPMWARIVGRMLADLLGQ